jgi:hypothetical protein
MSKASKTSYLQVACQSNFSFVTDVAVGASPKMI